MSVLVTGGAGYIGSHVVLECIDNGEDVVVVDLHGESVHASWRRPASLLTHLVVLRPVTRALEPL